MSDAKPTPGPWAMSDMEVVDGAVTVTTGDGRLAQAIAYVPGEAENWPEDVQQANARLIVAAGTAAQDLRQQGFDDPTAVIRRVSCLTGVLMAIRDNAWDDTETIREIAEDTLAKYDEDK